MEEGLPIEEQTQQPFTVATPLIPSQLDQDIELDPAANPELNNTPQAEDEASQPPIDVSTPSLISTPVIDASQQPFEAPTPQIASSSQGETVSGGDNVNDVPVHQSDNSKTDCKAIVEPLRDITFTPMKPKKSVLSTTKRNTPMVRRTRAGAARKASEKVCVDSDNNSNKQELVILRAENQVLKNAVENLERTITAQNNDLTEFRAELKFLTLEVKKISEARETSEHRLELLLEEQETKCTKQVQDLSSDCQKRRDKLSTKIQQLSQNNSTEKIVGEEPSTDKFSALETSLKEEMKILHAEHEKDMCNLQADIDRVDHVTAKIQSQVENWSNDRRHDPLSADVDTISTTIAEHEQPHIPSKPTPAPRPAKRPPPPRTQHPPPPQFNKKRQKQKLQQHLGQQNLGRLSPVNEHEVSSFMTSTKDACFQPHNTPANFPTFPPIPNVRDTKTYSHSHDDKNHADDQQANSNGTGKLAKTLIIMDSNQKHLTANLWKNSTILFCPTANELASKFPSLLRQYNPDMVLIHTGVNDLDRVDGATVARSLAQTVQKMSSMSPELKIVVSEIAPRKVNKDDQVKLCNQHLHTYFDIMDNVVMAVHSNLRTEKWEFHEDDKHFLKASIGRFAANLKSAPFARQLVCRNDQRRSLVSERHKRTVWMS